MRPLNLPEGSQGRLFVSGMEGGGTARPWGQAALQAPVQPMLLYHRQHLRRQDLRPLLPRDLPAADVARRAGVALGTGKGRGPRPFSVLQRRRAGRPHRCRCGFRRRGRPFSAYPASGTIPETSAACRCRRRGTARRPGLGRAAIPACARCSCARPGVSPNR